MHDIVIRGGSLVDGTGQAARTGDLAIKDGRIVEVGGKVGAGKREIDAAGAIVTPGWVDVHTHYDGQITWDPWLTPSTWHGVTSVVMGNCGVGFAPVRPEQRDWLIRVMEGVEDIPGPVLAEGIQWDWESFPQYLDALDRRPKALDVGAQVPHSAVRAYVMGERAVSHDEATPDDIKAMVAIVREGLQAGALGFSTTRTLIHKYDGRKYPPGTFAAHDEIFGLARTLGSVGHGVFQMTSNHPGMDGELGWLKQIARENGLPVAFALVQTDASPDLWKKLLAELDRSHAEGLPLFGAVAGRPAGLLMSWQTTIQPFMFHPLWAELDKLPWPARLARLRQPETRRQLIDGTQQVFEHDSRANYLTHSFHKMFALVDDAHPERGPDYEPAPERSVESIAARQERHPLEVVYDIMMGQDGEAIVYFPSFNYANSDLHHLHQQLQHPRAMMSLADGGAHCGFICDVSMPTYMLTHWVRGRSRGDRLPLELIVKRQTADTADVYGLTDRGRLQPGYKADVNIIDFDRLTLHTPTIAYDLPAGGRRLVQKADGYRATLVSGVPIFENGEKTGALPGKLMRGPQRLGQH